MESENNQEIRMEVVEEQNMNRGLSSESPSRQSEQNGTSIPQTVTVSSVTAAGPVCNMGVESTKQQSESVHFEPDSKVVVKNYSLNRTLAMKKKLAACSNGLHLEIKSDWYHQVPTGTNRYHRAL